MRKFIYSLSFCLGFSSLFAQYVAYDGSKAAGLIPKTKFIRFNETFKVPAFAEFISGITFNENSWKQEALKFLKDQGKSDLILYKTETDQLGWIHYRFYQAFNSHKVEGSQIIVHTKNGALISWNGEYYSGLPASAEASLTEVQALAQALKYYPAERYMWENPENEKFIQREQEDVNATFKPKGELVYISEKNQLLPAHFHLCYKFNIYAEEPLKRANIFIDAATGELINEQDLLHTGNVVGKATTKYSGVRNIYTDSVSPNNYRLRQTVLGKGVETYNILQGTNYGSAIDFTDTDNDWNNVNANKDEVATDAHFGAEQTYLFYKNSFGRKSYDNRDSKLLSYVHYRTAYDNASWDGQRMNYGDGNTLKPLTCIDVAAHEMSHGVTSTSSNLVYNGESGALNESFSDIFGAAVEHVVKGNNSNFIIGEDITAGGNGIRNMGNPSLFGDPGAYLDADWYIGAADNGGVHTNSGVQNHWFYILTMGDKGTNFKGNAYDVKAVGFDTSAAIAYRNNAFYLTASSKYADARFYSIQAAKDLYGVCSDVVKQTTNAWYAVNVGNQYDTAVNADFYANPTIICDKKDSAVFFNASSRAASFAWNFGDGGTSVLENPKHIYANYGTYNIRLIIQGCNGMADTATKTAYIQVDSSLAYCRAVKLPISGAGGTFNSCTGTLKDNGGDNNYADNADGYVVIAPTNAAYIKMSFTQFNMETPGDYLYIYEGSGTGGKLIGRYSGNSLPNGGDIYSTTGIISIRQVSDAGLNFSGFVMDWACIQKTTYDAGIISINKKNGRENTSIALTSTENIVVDIKNYGTASIGNFNINYKINGGSTVSETYTGSIAPGNLATYTFSQKADLSAAGYYLLEVWTAVTGDSINNQNDYKSLRVKQIENKPLKLPYFQDFENNSTFSDQEGGMVGIDSTDEYDYFNTRTGSGRMRTAAGNGFYSSGQRAITFDQSPATGANGPYNTNLLRLTVDLSQQTKDVYLDFSYMNHGDETLTEDSDLVWVRGNDQAAWVKIYDLHSNPKNGPYNNVTNINLTQALKNVSQSLGKSTQIMFGQKNNGEANTPNNTQTGDGISFDDIKLWIDVKDVGIAQMTAPVSGCGLSNAEQVKVTVFNYGTKITNQTGKINMRLDNGSIISQTVTFNMNANQTQTFTFSQTIDLSGLGNHVVDTWTELTDDYDSSNDSLTEQVVSNPAMTPLVVTTSGATSFCFGDSVVLTANSGYSSYLWSNQKTTPSITVKVGGNYVCTVTNSLGCKLSVATPVSVSYQPIAGFNWNISNNFVSFSNLTTNATSYKWYFGDGDSATTLHTSHTYMAKGTYTAKLIATNSCGENADQHNITIVNVLGVSALTNDIYTLAPNPFQSILSINFTKPESHLIRVMDVSGRLINQSFSKEKNVNLDLSALAPGLYIIDIDGIYTHKVVKE